MNGVVFQISDSVMTNSDDHRSPNQLKSLEPEPLVHEARVELEGVAPDEGGDHGDDPVGDEDRGADERPAPHDPVHHPGEAEPEHQLDGHARPR